MNPTVALPGSMTRMEIRLSSGSRCPQSSEAFHELQRLPPFENRERWASLPAHVTRQRLCRNHLSFWYECQQHQTDNSGDDHVRKVAPNTVSVGFNGLDDHYSGM